MKTAKRLAAIVTVIALASIALGVAGCGKSEPKTEPKAEHKHEGDHVHKYVCPMHPEVVQDAPGKCPKCSMDLVEKHI